MKIYTVNEILTKLDDCIINKKPFSLIRFGDGIKFLDSILRKNNKRILTILKKEGIPIKMVYPIFYLWGKYGSKADFIDSSEIYFSNKFWSRYTRLDVIPIMKKWREIYNDSEINNDNFCNPEFNFLSLLKIKDKKNLIDVIRNRNICWITNHPDVKNKLKEYCNIDIIEIVGWNNNHYKNCYKNVTKQIKKLANEYDVFLNSSGEVGRIYTGIIKQFGGRCLDVGSISDYLISNELPKRLKKYMYKPYKNSPYLNLLPQMKKYEKYI